MPEPHNIQRRRRMYVQADRNEGGEELQEDQIDAVLDRCEQLSLKLRQALQSQGADRCRTAMLGCMVVKDTVG